MNHVYRLHETVGSVAHTYGPLVVVEVKVTIKTLAFKEAAAGIRSPTPSCRAA